MRLPKQDSVKADSWAQAWAGIVSAASDDRGDRDAPGTVYPPRQIPRQPASIGQEPAMIAGLGETPGTAWPTAQYAKRIRNDARIILPLLQQS
ncbi:hypothetical protein A7J71_14090 [Achromobacter insolitus]|nr:hypothetical protein A7J71_14090 [Achromobacter insolitus]OCZ61444.1 hypothetical protein A7P22_24195 [Achromobacter insolitus]GLK93017.1 hypothetical protein GCM10008164_07530 [Achromobacter xylosoxidans]